jgi:hypothetical protein
LRKVFRTSPAEFNANLDALGAELRALAQATENNGLPSDVHHLSKFLAHVIYDVVDV